MKESNSREFKQLKEQLKSVSNTNINEYKCKNDKIYLYSGFVRSSMSEIERFTFFITQRRHNVLLFKFLVLSKLNQNRKVNILVLETKLIIEIWT